MLALPDFGMRRSISTHNVDLGGAADWIESSAMFLDDMVSKSEVVDVLCENHIYEAQGFAFELVDNVWGELKRRSRWLGSAAPFQMIGNSIRPTSHWLERPAHAFCLVLSLSRWYPQWASAFGRDYAEQGALFEQLSAESGRQTMPGWQVHQTGWTTANTKKLNGVVTDVARLLHESVGEVEKWTKSLANEAGLDLVWFRPFDDGRPGIPVYLMQCASGKYYEGKLHTPSLRIWARIVDFASTPRKAFSTPFSLADDEFTRVCNLVDGLLMDRYRLLAPGRSNPAWLPHELRRRLIAWMTPRISTLPAALR